MCAGACGVYSFPVKIFYVADGDDRYRVDMLQGGDPQSHSSQLTLRPDPSQACKLQKAAFPTTICFVGWVEPGGRKYI
jgi:hypothetical protein